MCCSEAGVTVEGTINLYLPEFLVAAGELGDFQLLWHSPFFPYARIQSCWIQIEVSSI